MDKKQKRKIWHILYKLSLQNRALNETGARILGWFISEIVRSDIFYKINDSLWLIAGEIHL